MKRFLGFVLVALFVSGCEYHITVTTDEGTTTWGTPPKPSFDNAVHENCDIPDEIPYAPMALPGPVGDVPFTVACGAEQVTLVGSRGSPAAKCVCGHVAAYCYGKRVSVPSGSGAFMCPSA